MIRGFSPDETHRINEAFKSNPQLQEVISGLFDSMVPLALMNLPSLQTLKGVRAPRSRQILTRLQAIGLEPARSNESLRRSVDRQYGCIEDAPVQALSVVERPGPRGRRYTSYEPMEIISFIRGYRPMMSVGDLVSITKYQLLDDLIHIDMQVSVGELEMRVDDLEGRLIEHGLRFTPESKAVYPLPYLS